MFDILFYVFENCRQADVSHDPERVARKLSAAGFDEMEISTALTWLAGVVRTPQLSLAPLPESSTAFRAFAHQINVEDIYSQQTQASSNQDNRQQGRPFQLFARLSLEHTFFRHKSPP
jgi:uncharacterized protein Smg (DUF494 family)